MRICKLLSIALVLGSLAYSASSASPSAAAEQQQETNPAALPEAAATDGSAPSLTLGGKIALDNLGPAIVGEDGTLKRITNWDELSDAERETAKRRISERNKERVEAIKQAAIKQQEAKAAEASKSKPGGGRAAAAEDDDMDEIDLAYRDVYDYKQLPVEDRAKFIEKMGDSGKQAFARRAAQYNNEKLAALSPEELAEKRLTADKVMDQVNPELREQLVKLLRDAKGLHGGDTKEETKRKAQLKNSKDEMKRLFQQRRERLEAEAQGAGDVLPVSDPDGGECKGGADGSCDQPNVEGEAAPAADGHDEL